MVRRRRFRLQACVEKNVQQQQQQQAFPSHDRREFAERRSRLLLETVFTSGGFRWKSDKTLSRVLCFSPD